jgi:hypothetical protein
MGKIVVLIFFAIGFIVFAFIKNASKGVKAAYRAVNEEDKILHGNTLLPAHDSQELPTHDSQKPPARDPEDQDFVAEMVDFCLMGLTIQLSFMNCKPPNAPNDDFSIGYVFGYCDSILQTKSISTKDMKAWAIITIVFNELFGMDEGAALFRRCLDFQENQSSDVYKGIMSGGEDFNLFLKNGASGEAKPPSGWYLYHSGKK